MSRLLALFWVAATAYVVLAADGYLRPAQPSRPAPATTVTATNKMMQAANQRCLECHASFNEDYLSMRHVKSGIGCVDCHGKSERHADDVKSLIAPERMIKRSGLVEFCLTCHEKAALPDVHDPFFKGKMQKKYCTDCHGAHRLDQRSRVWDKDTGRLLRKSLLKKKR